MKLRQIVPLLLLSTLALAAPLSAQMRSQKPVILGSHWVAVTGKPLAATAGAMTFQKGGNAVDAAVAMIAATCTMWDTLSWGGETQALIYNPITKKVIGVNGMGFAPAAATVDLYRAKGFTYPPEFGPLAATTPGTPGAIFMMEAEYGKLTLEDVLAPAIALADGYPIDRETADVIERNKALIKQWPYSRALFLPHAQTASRDGGSTASSGTAEQGTSAMPRQDQRSEVSSTKREGPEPGEMFRQPELAAMLRKLVEAEHTARAAGKSRREAIQAAYERFYRGDIARELVRGVQEQGGLFTMDDLAAWKPRFEEPVTTNYRGVDVYKLTVWTQGPVMLQALNILENFDLKSMGFNSAKYIHTLYQAMNLAYADRDFYYGDPDFAPAEPVKGLLSKEYARERARLVRADHNDGSITAGDPYPFQNEKNPFAELLAKWPATAFVPRPASSSGGSAALQPCLYNWAAAKRCPPEQIARLDQHFYAGTTSVEASDAEGWVVSVTPSGGWVPAVIGGHTGVGLSQRMQSFILDRREDPFNVLEPHKRPRVTLTPTLALKDGKPFLSFAVQGGDSQDQNLLQFFLDVVEFGFDVQQATEAPNFNSFQMRSSFGTHETRPGRILLQDATPPWVRRDLRNMGYDETFGERTSGPINAIYFDRVHGTMWGGSSNHGDDYGIGW
jgi:gamma-glutamyltranspeptidase/glutathione hydrolase